MSVPSKPTSSSCCKRGYWNALAYGAVAIWIFSVGLYILFLQVSYFTPYQPYIGLLFKIEQFFRYAYLPIILNDEPMIWWVAHRTGLTPASSMNAYTVAAAISFAILGGWRWIVFLGVLRAYWGLRRAPVTGWSALAAVFVMSAFMTICWVFSHP